MKSPIFQVKVVLYNYWKVKNFLYLHEKLKNENGLQKIKLFPSAKVFSISVYFGDYFSLST